MLLAEALVSHCQFIADGKASRHRSLQKLIIRVLYTIVAMIFGIENLKYKQKGPPFNGEN